MRKTNISLPVPAPFDLEATLLGHGWASLLPNVFDGESGEFRRVERLASGRVVRWRVPLKLANSKNALAVRVESTSGLTRRENDDLTRRLRHLLRLDEDFSGFYSMCARKGSPWDALCAGGGRLIRAPEIFEDLVKVILTTNIQWGGTKRMVAEIIQAYGASFPGDPALRAFPAPADIANDTLEAFKSSVNLGYRAEYIHELALRFSKGELAADDFLDADLPTPDLRKQLLSIKGVGAYAAATMLMLLGRYDDLPVDSIFRDFMAENYFQGREYDQAEALMVYEDWGRWKYLAYWFDVH